MVTTADFPQADSLRNVGLVPIAVAQGITTDAGLASFINEGFREREGRYNRHAAEVLGLISNHHNHAVLTPLGEAFVGLPDEASRTDFLARCLIETPVFRAGLRFILENQPSEMQLKQWFIAFYPGEANTADRRFNSFRNYLRDANLTRAAGERIQINRFTGSIKKKSESRFDELEARSPSNEPVPSTTEILRYNVDMQKREQANHTHWRLVEGMSSFLVAQYLQTYSNEHIDLFSTGPHGVVIYEMKSVTADAGNLISQIRKAVAQLFEYRYIHKQPEAQLCIVTNHRIAMEDEWLLHYLASDCGIAYIWTEDFVRFECDQAARAMLNGFWPD